ncbi:MAG: hypothetical protein AABZ44_00385, partial [Elusimicrobiota bacterium]
MKSKLKLNLPSEAFNPGLHDHILEGLADTTARPQEVTDCLTDACIIMSLNQHNALHPPAYIPAELRKATLPILLRSRNLCRQYPADGLLWLISSLTAYAISRPYYHDSSLRKLASMTRQNFCTGKRENSFRLWRREWPVRGRDAALLRLALG